MCPLLQAEARGGLEGRFPHYVSAASGGWEASADRREGSYQLQCPGNCGRLVCSFMQTEAARGRATAGSSA